MTKKKMQNGICRLCQKDKELSFEHIPPKSAFNKTTRYFSVPFKEFAKAKNWLNYKPKGKINQGGLGYHSLCEKCNGFLNDNYVRPYADWAKFGMSAIKNAKSDYNVWEVTEKNPFRILKQIIAMFIAMNEPWFGKQNPELLEFVNNPELKILSERYKIYVYLKSRGQIRTTKWSGTNFYGQVCELAFEPFGYILNIDNYNGIDHLTEISGWKNYTDERNHTFDIGLYDYPTYLPIPTDYRTKEEININH
ncbi:hypothetical protein [Aureibaculum luteum]|uniref:hypothetical protein n=1 Tax=Aureibaculum luteum TaxID=1548456 RepID=UPI000E4A3B78|nr:hypothetical protein [Aureibaculum luteum]